MSEQIFKIFAARNKESLEENFRKATDLDQAIAPVYMSKYTYYADKNTDSAKSNLDTYLKYADKDPVLDFLNADYLFQAGQYDQSLAKAKNCAITGSLVIIEGGNYYNRLLFVFPSGEIHYYNKRHLFTLAGEDKSYTKGTQKLIIEYRGWKICPLICYDLRFPVFARNVEQYDLLLYVANWPTIRIQAWDTLLKARAVENMSYTIGVNRVGKDEKDYDYSGHSQVVDFLGNYAIAPQETEGIFYAQLNKEALLKTRTKLGFLNDQDTFDWK